MALNKKHNLLALILHTVLYILPFAFIPGLPVWMLFAIGIEHAIQDGTKAIPLFMVMKGSAKFANPPFGPWSVVVTDNIVHLLFIYFLLVYFL